jgi:hypothetical protein
MDLFCGELLVFVNTATYLPIDGCAIKMPQVIFIGHKATVFTVMFKIIGHQPIVLLALKL